MACPDENQDGSCLKTLLVIIIVALIAVFVLYGCARPILEK